MNFLARIFPWWRAALRGEPIVSDDHRGPVLDIDEQGWIHGSGVIRMPSARGRGTLPASGPSCVVRHGTATPWGTGAAIARSWRASVKPHSAHVTIDVITEPARSAEVNRWRKLGWHDESAQLDALEVGAAVLYQHRSLLSVAWHAAGGTVVNGERVTTSGTVGGQGLNACSIGVEMACVGQVARGAGGRYRGWASGLGVGHGAAVPDDQVQSIEGRTWHTYPLAALELERRLDAALLERWPSLAGEVVVTPSDYSVRRLGVAPVTRPALAVGHVDVDPTRKADPYPTGRSRGLAMI